MVDGSRSKVVGIGTIMLSEYLKLDNVFFIPQLHCNLLSVQKIIKELGFHTTFEV